MIYKENKWMNFNNNRKLFCTVIKYKFDDPIFHNGLELLIFQRDIKKKNENWRINFD